MSGLSSVQPVTSLTEAFRASALRRTAGTATDSRLSESAILDSLVGPTESLDDASPLTVDGARSVATAATAGLSAGSLAAVVNRAVAAVFDGSSSAALGGLNGNVISTDPLRVLPGQPLPGLLDSSDAIALFLKSNVSVSNDQANGGLPELVDAAAVSSGLGVDSPERRSATGDSFFSEADLRGDLDPRLFEQTPVVAAGLVPITNVPVEFHLPAGLVAPALAGSGLNHVGTGQSSSQQAVNQASEARSAAAARRRRLDS